jgi:transcriptional regulator of arginine metabolism
MVRERPDPRRLHEVPLSRTDRLTLIARLLSGRRFSNQEELAAALARAGVEATQATLSRDLRSLGVAKRSGPDGSNWYELPTPATEALDRGRQMLDLKIFVNEVRIAQNLAVVKTPPGHASAVARAIDLTGFQALVGTVAGDDTVLCIMEDAMAAKRFRRDLENVKNGMAVNL